MGLSLVTGAIATVVFIAVIVIVSLDIYPIFRTWLGRIHIGRHSDLSEWNKLISQVGVKWLNDTPKVKVTDHTRFTILERVKGQYSAATLQDWQQALLLLGLTEQVLDNKDKKAIDTFLASKFNEKGEWKVAPRHVDSAILAYSVMKVPGINLEQYRPALDATLQLIKEHMGTEETVLYRKSMNDYRYVDTIGFICPFLTAYGMKFGEQSCIDLAMKQIRAYVQHGFQKQEGLPYHAYDVKTAAPLGLLGWGRGLGWFALGLIDMWTELPSNHVYKSELNAIVTSFANAAMKWQQPSGSWNWTVTRKESRSDSSTTVMLSWFLLRASALDELKENSLNSVTKAINYLKGVTRRDGTVDFSQGDTKDIGVYSTLFDSLPFTQGFVIRLGRLYSKVNESEVNVSTQGQREWSKV
ncbi:glycoside hydrolase family 88 protein [Paenibacillus sp. GSMTC-2017]|uniref:glycoside hydrolase family 88 protein n=1 Tax=Paenibacillus sp. GSMTC-2017 TaxID=2794350 RepID=UPI0018D60575|nr:glycoside hydrolase family 88 protein [Paenibacillus sp. GSMTC-2017]MBH5317294.1 glycoside hydrolase family 88 protein [Paenibacillus sp. GSMTC-2017]